MRKIYVQPSSRKKGAWTVGIVGFPVETKKSKQGAIALAERIMKNNAHEQYELTVMDVPATIRPVEYNSGTGGTTTVERNIRITPLQTNPANTYRAEIIRESIGGGYHYEIFPQGGSVITGPRGRGLDDAMWNVGNFYEALHSPYAVLPKLEWKRPKDDSFIARKTTFKLVKKWAKEK